MSDQIDEIRSSRDAALDALDTSIISIGDRIAVTTTVGPFLDQLTKRHQDLVREHDAISRAATDAVLALPTVIAAAAALRTLSASMQMTAQDLPNATKVLTTTAKILSLGQQFVDLIATAQK